MSLNKFPPPESWTRGFLTSFPPHKSFGPTILQKSSFFGWSKWSYIADFVQIVTIFDHFKVLKSTKGFLTSFPPPDNSDSGGGGLQLVK